ncbi:MAG: EamA family transporter [Hyphomicrobiaceae bacterium]
MVWLSVAGFLHFVFGRYCNYRAIAAIGTNMASPIQQWELLVSLAVALILLGEVLTPMKLLGTALLLLGPAISTRVEKSSGGHSGSSPGRAGGKAFEPRYAEGYTYAFLSIFGYGLSPICVRAGLEHASIGQSLAGGLISYITATIIVLAMLATPGRIKHVREMNRSATHWFIFAGFMVFISQLFRYMALAVAPVSVVAPIMRIQAIFRIYFSWILTRDYEIFDSHVIIGTVISVAGAVLLTLQTDAVAAALHLPASIQTILHWHWP